MAEEEVKEEREPLQLSLFKCIKEAQGNYISRQRDYQKYHAYCVRRLRRLRRVLHIKMADNGKHHRFLKKKSITEEDVVNNKYLLLVLMEAERAWSKAMQLREEGNEQHLHKRLRHATARLKKAVEHAQNLERLCAARGNTRTALESTGYCGWMTATLEFDREQWRDAMDGYVKAQAIFSNLAHYGDAVEQHIFHQYHDEIDPNIRYCKFNLEKSGDAPDVDELRAIAMESGMGGSLNSKLQAVMAEERKKNAAQMESIAWRGKKAPIRNLRVRDCLAKASDIQYEVEQGERLREKDVEKSLGLYSALLVQYAEAKSMVAAEMGSAQGTSRKEESMSADLHMLDAYLQHLLLEAQVRRDGRMARVLAKRVESGESAEVITGKALPPTPLDVVALYDSMLDHNKNLRGLGGGSSDEDVERNNGLAAVGLGYTAYRCAYMGRSYAMKGEWPEAMALYQRAAQHVENAFVHYGECKEPDEKELAHVEALETKIRQWMCIARVEAALKQEQGGKQQTTQHTGHLLQKLDDPTPNPTHLANFPAPALEEVAVSPLFYDVAWNRFQFPSLQKWIKEKEAPKAIPKRGLFGLW